MTRAPARPQKSSSARMASASGSSSLRVASPRRIATGREGGGASRCARRSQPSAQRAAKAHGALSVPKRSPSSSSDGSRTSSTERSTERNASAHSMALSARSSSKPTSAPTSVCVSVLSASRARLTADEIDSPCCSASRSAATSPWVYSRWRPAERCGLGYPKRRSHARRVFGLTFSKARGLAGLQSAHLRTSSGQASPMATQKPWELCTFAAQSWAKAAFAGRSDFRAVAEGTSHRLPPCPGESSQRRPVSIKVTRYGRC